MTNTIEHATLSEKFAHVSQHVDAESGYTVHIIGTAHVSKESAKQVVDLIQHVQPGIVMIELCNSRKGMQIWSLTFAAILLAPEEELEKQSKQSLWELIVSSYCMYAYQNKCSLFRSPKGVPKNNAFACANFLFYKDNIGSIGRHSCLQIIFSFLRIALGLRI